MKLRFVKFLTSRENEIEKKEGGEGGLKLRCLPSPSQAAARAPAPRSHLSSPPSFHSLSLHPAPPARIAPPQLLLRHGTGEQCPPAIPLPAVLLLPSFFIKLPKQQSVAVVTWRSTLPADPACRPSCSVRAPSSPAGPRPSGSSLVLHLLRFLPFLGAVHPQRLEP